MTPKPQSVQPDWGMATVVYFVLIRHASACWRLSLAEEEYTLANAPPCKEGSRDRMGNPLWALKGAPLGEPLEEKHQPGGTYLGCPHFVGGGREDRRACKAIVPKAMSIRPGRVTQGVEGKGGGREGGRIEREGGEEGKERENDREPERVYVCVCVGNMNYRIGF